MKTKLFALSILLLVGLVGCKKDESKPNHEPKTIVLPAKSVDVITKSNKFGIDLFTKTAEVEDGNIMLSPLSASSALTMLLNGCGNNTFTQIQQMLGFEGFSQAEINAVYKSLVSQLLAADPEVKLAIANAIWYRKGFEVKTPFLNAMNSDFSAHVEALDFIIPSALTTMNKWASDNTFGKIPKVLNEISSDAVMFLMNALYFKGTWTYQFDKSLTNQETFNLESGAKTNVDMMHISLNANVFTNNNCKALELNYGRTNYSMVIIVPNSSLSTFYESLNEDLWNSVSTAFNSNGYQNKWEVSLPKFKFSYEKILNDQLISLGMIDAFDSSVANLSGISDANIFVSFVKQNTFVEVNEEGTEAAAVTTIGIDYTSYPPQSNKFIVDKPFVFAIRERTTNTILFIGKVINPSL